MSFWGSQGYLDGEDRLLVLLRFPLHLAHRGPSVFAWTMTSESRDTPFLRCTWDEQPSTWNDFCRRVRLSFEQTPRRKGRLLAPRIVSEPTGRAWAITGDLSHRELCRRDGVIYLLQYLTESLGRLPVPDIGVRLEAQSSPTPSISPSAGCSFKGQDQDG